MHKILLEQGGLTIAPTTGGTTIQYLSFNDNTDTYEFNELSDSWFRSTQMQTGNFTHNGNDFSQTVTGSTGFIWQNDSGSRTTATDSLIMVDAILQLSRTVNANGFGQLLTFQANGATLSTTNNGAGTTARSAFVQLSDTQNVALGVSAAGVTTNTVRFAASNTTSTQGQLFIVDPTVNAGSAANGNVLTLVDSTTGRFEWAAAASAVTANNGLNINGTTSAVHLGGSLIENTTINTNDTAKFNFIISDDQRTFVNTDQSASPDTFLTTTRAYMGLTSSRTTGTDVIQNLNGVIIGADGNNSPILNSWNSGGVASDESFVIVSHTIAKMSSSTGQGTPAAEISVGSQGDLRLRGETNFRTITPNVNSSTAAVGQFLRLANATNGDAEYGYTNNFRTETTNYTVAAADDIIYVNHPGGGTVTTPVEIVITIPAPIIQGTTTKQFTIKRIDGNAPGVNVVRISSASNIDNESSFTITNLQAIRLANNGTTWYVIN